MSALDSIIAGVREELAARRIPMAALLEKVESAPEVRDVHAALSQVDLGIIAEVKRSSPSKGSLAPITDPASLARSYQDAGASMVSVLTEQRRFGGSLADLEAVRSTISIPVLRKDFMVDEYQFYEARAYGADCVLLIVAGLSKNQLKDYRDLASELGMQALIEVHTPDELDDAMAIEPSIVGVNSRNLKTLAVDRTAFAQILPMIPSECIAVAESGISTRDDVIYATEHGARALLVGEALVTAANTAEAIAHLRG